MRQNAINWMGSCFCYSYFIERKEMARENVDGTILTTVAATVIRFTFANVRRAHGKEIYL